MIEIWKPVKDFEGLYEISSLGNIRSVPRETKYVDGRIGFHKGRLLKTNLNYKGYVRVDLTRDGKKFNKLIHRMVAESFIDNTYGKEQVNHKDGNKTNNFVTNLEWVTNDENEVHANENKLRDASRLPKKVAQYTKDGELVATHRSIYQASLALGTNCPGVRTKISMVCKGKRKSCNGFVWKFI